MVIESVCSVSAQCAVSFLGGLADRIYDFSKKHPMGVAVNEVPGLHLLPVDVSPEEVWI